MKLVSFITESGIDIGSGHVMRCLTLANSLRALGWKCRFFVGKQTLSTTPILRDANFEITEVDRLPESLFQFEEEIEADWAVVDHYKINVEQERKLKAFCQNVFVIDDLADREHDCDGLLNMALSASSDDYKNLINRDCQLLLGARFALLRPEFAKMKEQVKRDKRKKPRRMLLSLGGADPKQVTLQVLRALPVGILPTDFEVDVVVGASYTGGSKIQEWADHTGIRLNLHVDTKDMAYLMAKADFAIGAGGGTTFERCCLGLPTIMLIFAKNQRQNAGDFERLGAVEPIDISESLGNLDEIAAVVERWLKDNGALCSMTSRAMNICDGLGAARVAEFLESKTVLPT